MRVRSTALLTVLLASLALAGCSAPAGTTQVGTGTEPTGSTEPVSRETVNGTPGAVGGTIKNIAPSFITSAQSATTGENRGSFAVVFTGQIKDPNTALQLKNVSIKALAPSVMESSHELTLDEKRSQTEPTSFGSDGWKIWVGPPPTGLLYYSYRVVFPALSPPGTYNFTLRAEDLTGGSAISDVHPVILTPYSDITISSVPVNATGASQQGQNWGQWNAEPGARNVESTNFIKLVNTGQVDGSRVVIDFAPTFVGASDANFTIPADNNVQFTWFEDTTPATSAPNEGTYTYAPANADGTVTVSFTGKSNIIYVKYQIVAMPAVLPIQSYGISFTVTEL